MDEKGRVVWRFSATIIARLFGVEFGRKVVAIPFGTANRLNVFMNIYGLFSVLFLVGLTQSIPMEAMIPITALLSFAVMLPMTLHCDFNLFFALNLNMSNIVSVGLSIVSGVCLVKLGSIDPTQYRGICCLIFLPLNAVLACTGDTMPGRIRPTAVALGNLIALLYYFVLQVLLNLNYFPNLQMDRVLFAVQWSTTSPEIVFPALSVCNQALYGLIFLSLRTVLVYVPALVRGRRTLLNAAVYLDGVDDPESVNQVECAPYLKPMLVKMGWNKF